MAEASDTRESPLDTKRREWISFHIDSYELVGLVDMDISVAGIRAAWKRSFQVSACEPNMVIVSPGDYHDAEKAISYLAGRMKLLNVIIGDNVPRDTWAVGCSYKPDSFVGSRGA